jgi:hypothetical protein
MTPQPVSKEGAARPAPKTKALYEGKLFVPCPACTAFLPEGTVRNIVETVLREANPELLGELRKGKER